MLLSLSLFSVGVQGRLRWGLQVRSDGRAASAPAPHCGGDTWPTGRPGRGWHHQPGQCEWWADRCPSGFLLVLSVPHLLGCSSSSNIFFVAAAISKQDAVQDLLLSLHTHAQVQYLALDEADRMLDMGFEPAVSGARINVGLWKIDYAYRG